MTPELEAQIEALGLKGNKRQALINHQKVKKWTKVGGGGDLWQGYKAAGTSRAKCRRGGRRRRRAGWRPGGWMVEPPAANGVRSDCSHVRA